MKSILLSGTAALLLVAASGAHAQQDQHQNDNRPGGDQHMSGPADQHGAAGDHNNNGFDHGSTGPAKGATTTHTTTHRTHTPHHTTTHTTTTTTTNGNDHGNNGFDHNGNNNNDHNNNGHDNNGFGHNNNGHPHAQINVKLKITFNATHHFRGPTWHPPRGYTYRRYAIGQRLEPAFYARDYWLSDYATYDLLAPPEGYTWVRFGPDAILIDEDTGEVVRVVYGVFE